MRRVLAVALLVGGCLGAPALASAAAPVEPYQTNDFKGFRDVLPPGTNGLANGPGLAAFLSTGARPAHSDDQLAMYRDLVYASPGVTADTLSKYYKDSSFGVKPGDVERTYTPGGRDDVTALFTAPEDERAVPHERDGTVPVSSIPFVDVPRPGEERRLSKNVEEVVSRLA